VCQTVILRLAAKVCKLPASLGMNFARMKGTSPLLWNQTQSEQKAELGCDKRAILGWLGAISFPAFFAWQSKFLAQISLKAHFSQSLIVLFHPHRRCCATR